MVRWIYRNDLIQVWLLRAEQEKTNSSNISNLRESLMKQNNCVINVR